METKEGQQTEEKKVETMPQPEANPPVTAEQPNLQEEIVELNRKYNETVQALKGTQQSLVGKNRLLKEKEDVRGEIETLKNMVKILAVRPQAREDEDLETTAKQKSPDIDKAFAELENQRKVSEYQRKTQEQIDAIKSRVESLGLTENDEAYWEIYKIATNATPADFKLADIRLKKIESEKEKKPVDNKPTDEKDKVIATLQKEVEKLKKIASGELDIEKGLPSGAAANEAQIRKAFRENPRNPKIREDFLEMQRSKT